MLTQAQVHRAATTAVKDRYGWHVALEHRSGALGATPSRFVTRSPSRWALTRLKLTHGV